MALSAFDDKTVEPQAADLQAMLGRSSAAWKKLIARIEVEHAPFETTWNFSGAKWGWSLRLKQKKRTVLYMTPCERHFLVGMVLGEKAVKAARLCELPEPIMALIDDAPRYAEGRGFRTGEVPEGSRSHRDSGLGQDGQLEQVDRRPGKQKAGVHTRTSLLSRLN